MAGTGTSARTRSTKASDNPAGVDFDNLRTAMCKFPLGGIDDAPERFCGEPIIEGEPYSSECAKRAYTRPE
jgi:hypothetical protein